MKKEKGKIMKKPRLEDNGGGLFDVEQLLAGAPRKVVIDLPRDTKQLKFPRGSDTKVADWVRDFASFGNGLTILADENFKRSGNTALELAQRLPTKFGAFKDVPLGRIRQMLQGTFDALENYQGPRGEKEKGEAVRGLAKALLADLETLIELASKFATVRREFTVVIDGDEADVTALAAKLLNHAVTEGKAEQKARAEQYGWTPGKTPCCERNGYNCPDGSVISVHEVEAEVDLEKLPPEAQAILQLVEMFGGLPEAAGIEVVSGSPRGKVAMVG